MGYGAAEESHMSTRIKTKCKKCGRKFRSRKEFDERGRRCVKNLLRKNGECPGNKPASQQPI